MATQVAADTLARGAGTPSRGRSPRLWQDAVAAGRTTARLPRPGRRRLASRSPGRRRPSAVEELANGLLALGVRKGDAFAILGSSRASSGRSSTSRSRSIGAIGAADLREQLAEGRAVHPRALGVGRRALRGRRAAREARRYRARNPRLEHVLTFADLDDLRARGRAYAADAPGRARARRRRRDRARTTSSPTSTRRGRPARRRPA